MDITKKVLIFFAVLSLMFTFSNVQEAYAKYRTDANANANISIARWNILVNNQDIKANRDFSSSILPVFLGSDTISSGIIAPGAEGYFDLTVNSTNADVSFLTNITVKIDGTSNVQDLIVTGYQINDGVIQYFNTNNYVITDTTEHDETSKIRTYRFYIKWDDSDTAIMNNAADTEATKKGNTQFQVDVSFIQKAN